MKQIIIGLLAGALVATTAVAAKPADRPLGVEASIPFANSGGIRNFQADEDNILMIEDQSGRWYRATLFAPCTGLPFAYNVGFVTRGTNSFDKFSEIVIEGHSCMVTSLVTAAKPLTRKERKAMADKASPSY